MGRRARRDLCLALIILAGVALTAMLAATRGSGPTSWPRLLPNWWYASDDLTQCKSNLKNIGTAMEMYSTDCGGRFPHDASCLTPNYLKRIPTCPTVGSDTYTAGFANAS